MKDPYDRFATPPDGAVEDFRNADATTRAGDLMRYAQHGTGTCREYNEGALIMRVMGGASGILGVASAIIGLAASVGWLIPFGIAIFIAGSIVFAIGRIAE